MEDDFDTSSDDSASVDLAYQEVAAEMRGIARCTRAYFRTLLHGPFNREEAFRLVRDWHESYWNNQHAAISDRD